MSDIHGINDPGYASTAFMVVNSALVFLMTPGLGLFYAGLSRKKNALSNMLVNVYRMI